MRDVVRKPCVILDGRVINIGPWDDLGGANPMPEGAVVEERDFEYTEEFGWREVGWIPPLSEIEQLKLEHARASAELVQIIMAMKWNL